MSPEDLEEVAGREKFGHLWAAKIQRWSTQPLIERLQVQFPPCVEVSLGKTQNPTLLLVEVGSSVRVNGTVTIMSVGLLRNVLNRGISIHCLPFHHFC